MLHPIVLSIITCGLVAGHGRAYAREDRAPDEPSSVSLRLGAAVGGSYDTNVFLNASTRADGIAVGRLTIDADWLASDAVIFKLAYRGEFEIHNEEITERQTGHVGDLTLGVRPSERVYVYLRSGGEYAAFPNAPLYTFAGAYGQTGARFEVGDTATVRTSYHLRVDRFPNYDLDNTSHTGQLLLQLALGGYVEVDVLGELVATLYNERFLLDPAGDATGEHRSGRAWRVEPALRIFPSFSWRISGGVRGEYNDSNDTYYYTGPFGRPLASVPPELIHRFDSYYGVSTRWELRWQPIDSFATVLRAAAGSRWFTHRPAFDAQGLDSGESERDLWIQPGVELEWRFSSFASLVTAYSFARQWSNDPLWDYDAHRLHLLVALWYES